MSTLDAEIERLLCNIKEVDPNSDEYKTIAENIRVLCDARSKKPHSRIDWNIAMQIVGVFAEILIIVNFEKLNVLTSKAMSRVRRV